MIVCALDLVTIDLPADMTTGIVFAQQRLKTKMCTSVSISYHGAASTCVEYSVYSTLIKLVIY